MKSRSMAYTGEGAMKSLVLAGLVFLGLLQSVGASERCDDCPVFSIGLFDSALPPRPTDPSKIWGWVHLSYFGGGVRIGVRENDPKRECVRWIDGGVWNAFEAENGDGVLRFGSEFSNLPPAGALGNLEYLVQSRVDGSDGGYAGTAFLEDAVTREMVAAASVHFRDPFEALEAGKQAGAQLASAFQKIRTFQKRKRDQTNGMICPKMEIRPERGELKTNESVSVEIEVYDCDGKPGEHPLKGREVELSADGGRLDRDTVITDDQGKARVIFRAGSKPGVGVISGHTHGQTVMHYVAGDGASATVKIERDEEVWRFKATIESIEKDNWDGVSDDGGRRTGFYTEIKSAQISGIVKQRPGNTDGISFFWASDERGDIGGSKTVSVHAQGKHSKTAYRYEFRGAGDHIDYALISSETASGGQVEDSSVDGSYSSADKAFWVSFGVKIKGDGQVQSRYWWTAGDPPSWQQDSWNYEPGMGAAGNCNSADETAQFSAAPGRLTARCRSHGPNNDTVVTFEMVRLH
jgi:hypothetical protein